MAEMQTRPRAGWLWTGLLLGLFGQPALVGAAERVNCEGKYPQHLQGICLDETSIFWCFTTQLVKTFRDGKLLRQIPVAKHHGDLCLHEGQLFVAVNLGDFNQPPGKTDSWVYVDQASDLKLFAKHAVSEVVHGAGGLGVREGRVDVLGGLPKGMSENFVSEYDCQFRFQKRHVIASGHTDLGIQTATFTGGRWYFGYGKPEVLLVTDADFRLISRTEFPCAYRIATRPDGGLLGADNIRLPNQ